MKKRYIIIATIILALTLFSVVFNSIAQAKDNLKNNVKTYNLGESLDDVYKVYTVIDDETGVNYMMMSRWNFGGEITMCPRYNADGTLYVTE